MSKKDTMETRGNVPVQDEQPYKGLPELLHGVRWTQHLFAILAEILILIAFAMSGMDVSLGGIMTNIGFLKWFWGAVFALGIDTSFVIAWVRVRQCVINQQWGALVWNIILALGMSFIVFQPVAIQLFQQALSLDFNSALAELGINLIILVYARAIVAVLLGAILAMTNVETGLIEQVEQCLPAQPKRRLIVVDRVLNKIAPVVDAQPAQSLNAQSGNEQVVIREEPVKQIAANRSTSLRIVETNTQLEPYERVKQVLSTHPDCSDRELGRLSGMAPATAKKYRTLLNQEKLQAM